MQASEPDTSGIDMSAGEPIGQTEVMATVDEGADIFDLEDATKIPEPTPKRRRIAIIAAVAAVAILAAIGVRVPGCGFRPADLDQLERRELFELVICNQGVEIGLLKLVYQSRGGIAGATGRRRAAGPECEPGRRPGCSGKFRLGQCHQLRKQRRHLRRDDRTCEKVGRRSGPLRTAAHLRIKSYRFISHHPQSIWGCRPRPDLWSHDVKFSEVGGVSPSDLEGGLEPGREIGAMNPEGFPAILVLGYETRKENPVKMNDTATPRAEASSLLAPLFFDIPCEEGITFEEFESRSIAIGHAVIAGAMSMAIERLDARLCLELPEGCRVHDRRGKTLAGEVGDLRFRYRRVRNRFGNTVVPYADALCRA